MGDVLWIIVSTPNGDTKLGSGQIGAEEATRQLAVVLAAIDRGGGTLELPWLVARVPSVIGAYTGTVRG